MTFFAFATSASHTLSCRKSIYKSARIRCRLLLHMKRLRRYYLSRWSRCSHCCHDFLDLSLHNFSSFLCGRHEQDANKLLTAENNNRIRVCQINRHCRYRYLKHRKWQNLDDRQSGILHCPRDSFPSWNSFTCKMHTVVNAEFSHNKNSTTTESQRKYFSAHCFGPPTCVCSFCGSLVWIEERVKRSGIANPLFSICCQRGKVQLPRFQQPPEYLMRLLDYNGDSVSKHFRHSIRSYNSVFAFTSIGGHVDTSVNNGGGPYIFRINGQNHHRIGSLLPTSGKPKFAQLYFYDTDKEVRNQLESQCTSSSTVLDELIVQNLITMFDTCNPLVQFFRMARDRFHRSEYQPISIRLLERRYKDGRMYNLPTCSEVVVLIDNSNVDSCGSRDIVVEERNGILKRISEKHPSFMSMQYPILFPFGEDGFRANILYRHQDVSSSTKRTTVTMREYYAYLIQCRQDDGAVLLLGGRLFQQFVVDSYTAVEEDRLMWVKSNQSTLRSELYKGLHDAIAAGDTNARTIGKKVILPSSFTGGPRYMVQNYQDAMAICRWAGSPDYFVTFTCNPKWSEIEMALSTIPGQRTEDRPDIVSRVFHMKLLELMHDIKTESHFGKVKAIVYTIEFQKRGLPHAHILIFVFGDQRPNTAGQVDSVVSAEIPDKTKDLLAYQSVCQYMIHGPCGNANPQCPCMVDGMCSRHYPKQYNNETVFDKYGFPIYRRRNNGVATEAANGFARDNGWVIPHNVDLVVKYQAHINVEVCNKARSVKYLFKYINKGHDRASVIIQDSTNTEHTLVHEVDEIKTYLDCRYISASEASWRIYEFDVQYRIPAVERLSFHMPDEHTVYFDESECLADVQDRDGIDRSMFNQWLETNKTCDQARHLTYVDFPTRWVWVKSNKQWKMRQKGECIGRIFYAHPTSGERFYLRMLLNVVRGPTCYQDIRTVDNIVYNTFKDACIARGLLEDDNEWDDALTEAASWSTAKCLRELFATLLLFCEVSNPKQLWIKHWESLADDIQWQRLRMNHQTYYDMHSHVLQAEALRKLEKILNRNNRSLHEFWSVDVHEMSLEEINSNKLIMEEVDYDCDFLKSETERLLPLLNAEQKFVFESVSSAVQNHTGGFYFVYGSGGTGKTFLWNTLISSVRSEGKIVLAVASSGIASLLLPGGRTAHSKFKIPITLDDVSTCNISKQSSLADLLRRTDLIIWDEAPMIHRNALEAFEKTLTDIVSYDSSTFDGQIFGGKTVVLGGDFRQTLPVVPKGTRHMIVHSCINHSTLWDSCKVFTLKTNMRLKNNDMNVDEIHKLSEFSRWILDVGEGKIPSVSLEDDEEPSWIQIPQQYLLPHSDDPIRGIVENTYPDLQHNMLNKDYFKDRCILSPTNDCVEEINSYIISLIHGDMQTYLSADSISPISDTAEDHHLLYPTEFLHTLKLSGLPNHEVRLKVGVPIMLLRNLNQNLGLCNGTRLIVTQLSNKVVEGEIITGNNIGKKVLIPRIVLTSTDTKWPFILRRRQFPVKVCFAMTINKSQGQTLEHVGIYLPKPVFTHGQLYVAISRATSFSGLKMLIGPHKHVPPTYTQNIVYKEIFVNLPGEDDIIQH